MVVVKGYMSVFVRFCKTLPHCSLIREIPLSARHVRWLGISKFPLKPRADPVIMKLETPEFKKILTPEVTKLASIFDKYGYEIRICGGAVRDLLMGKQPKDLDFATVATPSQMREMFIQEQIRMINMNGETHGTVTPRINDKENFEVTTLRIDVETDGRHAVVEFTTDWQVDALRRDLTVNSMFLGLDGTVYDYFHGYEDLLKKRVVFVGNAEDRIKEDHLRILRYFRFYGRIAESPDKHEESVLQAIRSNVEGLGKLSGERIASELRLILSGNYAFELFEKIIDIGAGPYIGLPEVPNIEHFHEVKSRTRGDKLHPVSIITSLLRDEVEVFELIARLKLSAFERNLASFIVEHREEKLCPKPLLPYQKKILLNTTKKGSDVHQWCVQVLRYQGHKELANELEAWVIPRFPVKASTYIDRVPYNMRKDVVCLLKEYWAEHDYRSSREEILAQLPSVMEKLGLSPVHSSEQLK